MGVRFRFMILLTTAQHQWTTFASYNHARGKYDDYDQHLYDHHLYSDKTLELRSREVKAFTVITIHVVLSTTPNIVIEHCQNT